ncbi:triose-phosphate isomerase [Corallococcus sp. AB004]|uniref:Triosephosphate isomerase n=1 Tax=Corallococcus exiguus TaxID=83462 RepID=A0A7X4YFC8_9BACT|nr:MULTISPECIES: triose-phosphate isomerase [Corallococcus]RKI46492.1 triose-phosphate isomerase [Corallococcus sp. AB004]MBN8466978.1 triose-phosphate isomerase [Corallococcus exiguus]NBC44201.1 triose-phosphate isomerase [Corallococcus exiguus]NPC46767.1 triose-phosphate isomerase [Corallococcus exiguus]NPC68924.1 triose-phosphate isomerase [Corallococcus exiguus]
MARRKIVAGNWKMNKTVPEALALVRELRGAVAAMGDKVEVAIAPPFVALQPLHVALEGAPLQLAAQNCHWESSGAFTGEISAPMLAELGCAYVIVGHSERRQFFGETDATVNKRAKAVKAAGMTPIVCVGETLAERESNQTLTVVERQVRGALEGFSGADVATFVMAYEPVWAIGTGRTATTAQAQEVHAAIRGLLTRMYDEGTAERVRIQYGGSVKPDNAAELLGQPDVDGALVGGASLKAADFVAIVKAAG